MSNHPFPDGLCDTRAAKATADKYGLGFVAYSGGSIETMEEIAGKLRKVKSRGCVVNGTMYVRTDDQTFTAEQIAGHEAAHEQIRKGEIDVKEVRKRLLDEYEDAEINAIINLYSQAYGDSGLDPEAVFLEIVCDAVGKMNAFATESTRSLAGEVGVFLRNVRKSVRRQEGGGNKSGTQNTGSGEVRHSIVETVDGRLVAVVDNDILSQIDTNNWSRESFEQAKKAASEALKKFRDGVVVNGITRKINRDSRREFTRSNYTEMIRKRNPDVFADKMRFADITDDVIIASSGWKNDGGLLHKRNDNYVDFVHGNTLLMAGINKYNAEVVVGITNSGDYVFYDLVDIVPTKFDVKKEESPSTATTEKPIGDIQGDSYNGIIAQDVGNVKNKHSRQIDEKYLSAVKSGDMDVAQELLDKAAKEAGYEQLFYHGSKKGGGFTQFRDWQYFTQNKAYAQRYAKRDEPGSLYTVYAKMETPFDTRDAEARAIFQEARQELGLGEIQESGLPDWTDGYDLSDYIDENDLDYDSIVLDEGGDMVNGKPVSRGLSYVIRKSNQVKSADVVTYDDDGNIIPLSERFNTENADIRYSREMDPVAALEKQVKLLRQQKEYWKSQTKRTDGKKADSKAVRKLGRATVELQLGKIVKNVDFLG